MFGELKKAYREAVAEMGEAQASILLEQISGTSELRKIPRADWRIAIRFLRDRKLADSILSTIELVD